MNPSPFVNMYYFYLLQSINTSNEIYTGSTNNLRLRLSEHNKGKVFSTKRYLPWGLIYSETYLSEKDARLREQKLKRHGKGNQELKKRLANSLTINKKGESKDSSLTLLGKNGESKGLPLTIFSKNGEGFTLTEILVAVAVFSLAMLIATSVFMVATMHQRQTSAGQALQSDIRFAMESIVRDVKYGTIDYNLYSNGTCVPGTQNYCSNNFNAPACNTDSDCVVDLSAAGQNPVSILALRDVDGNRTRYRVDPAEQKLMVCKIILSTDSLAKCDDMSSTDWSPVTPDNVEMRRGDFYLYPFFDPMSTTGCGGSGPYCSDSQPRVTLVLHTVQRYPNGGIQQFITSQTTAVSRLYSR